jgi:3-dehydroquinate dehydratase-2
VERLCRDTAAELGLSVEFRQSNREGELVDWLQEAGAAVAAGSSIGAVLNPAAYSHTSIALPDAIEGARLPLVEVHISNVHRREPFRHHSYVSAVAAGVVVGFGVAGYPLAIRGLHALHARGKDG